MNIQFSAITHMRLGEKGTFADWSFVSPEGVTFWGEVELRCGLVSLSMRRDTKAGPRQVSESHHKALWQAVADQFSALISQKQQAGKLASQPKPAKAAQTVASQNDSTNTSQTSGTKDTENMAKAASWQASPSCKRLTYKTRSGLTTAYLAGRKEGTIQPYDYGKGYAGAFLHTGNYDRSTGDLIGCACTLSFRSVKAAKRYLTELTRYRRNAGAA